MRLLFAVVGVGVFTGCAATTRTCPTEAQLATADRPTGRVEWCARKTGGMESMPAPGREYPSLLGMAHPPAMSGFHGPFTHWYPNGAVESHGNYVEDGSPDGVWGFWYQDGSRKRAGRYDHGKPVGCFSVWDEQGNQVIGIVDGDHLRIEQCEPPIEGLAQVEERSQSSARERWGDVSLHTFGQGGAFGARNETQQDADPSARVTVQGALRKHLGRFRVGPALGLRLSDSNDSRAYSAGVVAAIGAPLVRRVAVELEAQLGIQYLEVTARRNDVVGDAHLGFWAPLGGVRGAVSFAATPTLHVVGGVGVDGAFARDSSRMVSYCAPFCGPPVDETWKLGGFAYGIDVGLRLMLR